MAQAPNIKENLQTVVEIGIRIGFLVLLIAWCLRILHPFASVIVWGLILALGYSSDSSLSKCQIRQ